MSRIVCKIVTCKEVRSKLREVMRKMDSLEKVEETTYPSYYVQLRNEILPVKCTYNGMTEIAKSDKDIFKYYFYDGRIDEYTRENSRFRFTREELWQRFVKITGKDDDMEDVDSYLWEFLEDFGTEREDWRKHVELTEYEYAWVSTLFPKETTVTCGQSNTAGTAPWPEYPEVTSECINERKIFDFGDWVVYLIIAVALMFSIFI